MPREGVLGFALLVSLLAGLGFGFSWRHFRLSQISLISPRFHCLQWSGTITRRKLALFSGGLLAVSYEYQSIVQATDKIFHCPSILHTCQCSMPELVTLSLTKNRS